MTPVKVSRACRITANVFVGLLVWILWSFPLVGLLVSTPLVDNYLESAVSLYLLGLSAIIQLNLIMTWVNVVAMIIALLRKHNEPSDENMTVAVGPKSERQPVRLLAARIHHLVIITAAGEDESRVVSTLESIRQQRVVDVAACVHVTLVLGPQQDGGERRRWLRDEFGSSFADFECLDAPALEPDEVSPRAASERAALQWFAGRRLVDLAWRPSVGSSGDEETGTEWASESEEAPRAAEAALPPALLVNGAPEGPPAAVFEPLGAGAEGGSPPVRFVEPAGPSGRSSRRRRARRPAELRVPLARPRGPSAASASDVVSLEAVEPVVGGGDGGAGALSRPPRRPSDGGASPSGDSASEARLGGLPATGLGFGREASEEHLMDGGPVAKADVLVTCCGSFASFQDDYFWTATKHLMLTKEADRPWRIWQAAVFFDYWEGWVFERVISTIRCWLQIGMFGPMQVQPSCVYSALWALFERAGLQDARFCCPDVHAFLSAFLGAPRPVRIEAMATVVVTRFAPSSFSPPFGEAARSLFGHFRQLGCRTQQELAFLLAARPRVRFAYWLGLSLSSLLLDPIIAQLGFVFVFWSFLPTYLRPSLTAVVARMSFDRAFIVVNAAAIVTIGSLFLITLYFEYRHRGPWKRRRRSLLKSFVMLLENVLSPFVLLAFMSLPFLLSMTQMALGVRLAPPPLPTPAAPLPPPSEAGGATSWFRPKGRPRSRSRLSVDPGSPQTPSQGGPEQSPPSTGTGDESPFPTPPAPARPTPRAPPPPMPLPSPAPPRTPRAAASPGPLPNAPRSPSAVPAHP